MFEFLSIMAAPTVMAFILVGICAYLGLHVVSRGVIFVDISLAQVAALGTSVALVFGAEPGSLSAYLAGASAALLGATLISLTRAESQAVPQEAYIGITYAVAASLMTLVLSRSPHGAEEVESLLVGQLLWVRWPVIAKTAGIFIALGVVHWVFRRGFLLVSLDPARAFASGMRVRRWDLAFYATVALAVTSSVQVAGVLLVFTLLVVPSVIGMHWASSLRGRLLVGWGIGLLVCLLGAMASYFLDLPTGPAIVGLFGLAVTLSFALRAWTRRRS